MTSINLPARRKMSAFTCLLLAIVMLLAGLFVSAPAQAANPVSVIVDVPNQTITYKQSYPDAPNVLFVVADARGAHNVQVPNDNVGKTEAFGPEWGATANVRFLDPTTNTFTMLGDFALTPPEPPAPPVQMVALCHANGDSSYTRFNIPVTVFFAEHVNDVNDIVPPVTYVLRGNVVFFPGFHWDEAGIAIFNNNCVPIVTTPPTPTETTAPPLPDDTDSKMVEFCHATHPRAEAYEPKNISVNAFLQAGHGQHEGDITPPFTYVKQGVQGSYPGNRWTEEGIAIFNNGCSVIPVTTPSPTETTTPTETAEPTPTETTSPTTTPAPSETTSPTASSSPTETATEVPTSAAPSTSQGAAPAKSKTAVAAASVSRYPAAAVDTAVKGSSGTAASPIALLLFGGAAIALLMAFLLFRSAGPEGRRH